MLHEILYEPRIFFFFFFDGKMYRETISLSSRKRARVHPTRYELRSDLAVHISRQIHIARISGSSCRTANSSISLKTRCCSSSRAFLKRRVTTSARHLLLLHGRHYYGPRRRFNIGIPQKKKFPTILHF